MMEIFGAGTAAIVAPVRKISWKGRLVDCGLADHVEAGPVAQQMKEWMEAIQYGDEDHPWRYVLWTGSVDAVANTRQLQGPLRNTRAVAGMFSGSVFCCNRRGIDRHGGGHVGVSAAGTGRVGRRRRQGNRFPRRLPEHGRSAVSGAVGGARHVWTAACVCEAWIYLHRLAVGWMRGVPGDMTLVWHRG